MGEHGNSIDCWDSTAFIQVVHIFKENHNTTAPMVCAHWCGGLGDNSQSQHSPVQPKPTEQMKLRRTTTKKQITIKNISEMWEICIHIDFDRMEPMVGTVVGTTGFSSSACISSISRSIFSALRSIKSMENVIVRIMCHITFHCLSIGLDWIVQMVWHYDKIIMIMTECA